MEIRKIKEVLCKVRTVVMIKTSDFSDFYSWIPTSYFSLLCFDLLVLLRQKQVLEKPCSSLGSSGCLLWGHPSVA